MGVKLKKPLLIVNSVAPGKTATVNIPTDPRYFKLCGHIQATGQVLNEIVSKFRLKVGTKTDREFSPDQLDHVLKLMAENGGTQYAPQNNTAGLQIDVPIWFMEPWRKTYAAQRSFAWPTGNIPEDGFILEIELKDTADASVTMDFTAYYDNPVDAAGVPMPMQKITKWYDIDVPINGTTSSYKGLEKVDDLQSLHFYDQGTIDKIELIVGDVTVREIKRQENESDLIGLGMTPNDDWFDVIIDDDDDPLSALPLAGSKNVIIKMTLNDGTPTTIPLLVQRYGPRD